MKLGCGERIRNEEDEKPPGVAPCPKDFGPVQYPEGEELSGTVVKEVGTVTDAIKGNAEYYKVIQRIDLDNRKKDIIRFTYYRRTNERFYFGSNILHRLVDDTPKLLKEAKEAHILPLPFRGFLRPDSWINTGYISHRQRNFSFSKC